MTYDKTDDNVHNLHYKNHRNTLPAEDSIGSGRKYQIINVVLFICILVALQHIEIFGEPFARKHHLQDLKRLTKAPVH